MCIVSSSVMIELAHINPIFRQSVDYMDQYDSKTFNVMHSQNSYATMVTLTFCLYV
jgi:hypothetical protein